MTVFGFLVFLLGMLPITSAGSRCKLDLGFVVDTTKSIKQSNIPKLKEALRLLIEEFDIADNGTHVSFETFASDSTIHNYFKDTDYYTKEAILDLIDSSIGDLSKPTRLDLALQMAEDMFIEDSGHRPGIPAVMVLFTDGRSHPRQTSFKDYKNSVKHIKSKGVRLVVVAIGPDAQKQRYRNVLNEIGGNELIFVDDYEGIGEMVSDITGMICPPNPCEDSPGLDVAFVVDRTGSVGVKNFELMKGFLLQLTDVLTIGPNGTHTGFVLFDKTAEELNTFADSEYYSGESVHYLVENIPNKLGKRTFIDRALMKADEALFTVEGGDRPVFPNVLVLLTDGRTNPDSEPFSGVISSLKAKGVRIVAIGIGEYEKFEGQLEEIAGENVYSATNFNQLSDMFAEILKETCSVDGVFSRWSFWSDCSVTCGEGIQTRSRTCTNPPPQGPYGDDCDGELKQTRPCNDGTCTENIPRHLVDFREVFERPLPELEREWDYAHLRRRNPKILLRKLRQEYDANE